MKGLRFKKKNLIATALVAILALGCFGVGTTQAAGKIEDKKCSLTFTVPKDSTEGDFAKYNGFITVRLYKVAGIDSTGNYKDAIVNLDAMKGDNVDTETINTIAKAAYDKLELSDKDKAVSNAVASIICDFSNGNQYTESNVDQGLYLYVPQPTYDDKFDYEFGYYLVSLPSSNYIAQSTTVNANGEIVDTEDNSDDWLYDVNIRLKAKAKPRYGSLEITKTLKTYNESLGNAAFVFSIEAVDSNNKTVFSDVRSIDFSKHGSKTVTVEKIPAGSTVTVTEEYSGASYTIDSEDNRVQKQTISADKVSAVSFVNDYDNRLVVGGLSIENHFVKSNDENVSTPYEFDGSNLLVNEAQ